MGDKKTNNLYIDANRVRVIASLVIITGVGILITKNYWLSLGLAIDFGIRAFTSLPSPFGMVAKFVSQKAGWVAKPVFAPPKKFAAGIGCLFSLLIAVLLYLQIYVAAYIVVGVLLSCATLESFFNICVGCYAYDWFVAPFRNSKNE